MPPSRRDLPCPSERQFWQSLAVHPAPSARKWRVRESQQTCQLPELVRQVLSDSKGRHSSPVLSQRSSIPHGLGAEEDSERHAWRMGRLVAGNGDVFTSHSEELEEDAIPFVALV
jgi:hypothetical protein